MSYRTWIDIYSISALTGIFIWTVLVLRLVYGLVRRRSETIKSSIKYLFHSLTFLFVAIVYFSFAIVVNGPRGEERIEWVKLYSLEWLVWATGIALTLAILNHAYQTQIEKNKNLRLTIILSCVDFLVMCYGIFIGGRIALAVG